ncbi:thyrotropin-releasing hormone receptor-like [Patiria miniata]|uniref:G-protein coupled receptors family 1 profile domain-containing protein n=1 Tax=Patiria miniata TaxID=46514 RepID=A0A914B2A6_PATMI|nr:thyrotropin-releasing hormone receptor-like [Patiria miniata]
MENQSVANSTEFLEDPSLSSEAPIAANGSLFKVIVHAILFVVGVPGNCLILRVYWTKTHKTSTHIFIMALAWADLAVCSLRWRRISVESILLAGGQIPKVLHIIWTLTTTSGGASVLFTAVIAADRYDCVCRAHNRFFTKRRAQAAVCMALSFSFAINIPAFIAMITDPSDAVLRMLVLAFQVLCFGTALVMIAVCYGLVYVTIRKHVRVGVLAKTMRGPAVAGMPDLMTARSAVSKTCDTNIILVPVTTHTDPSPNISATDKTTDAPSSSRGIPGPSLDAAGEKYTRKLQPVSEERPRNLKGVNLQRKTTRMLFITSVVFLLLWLPYWTSVVLEFASFGLETPINPTFMRILGDSTALLFVNNAVNPVIYGLANKRFRKDCWQVLQKIKLW